MIVMDMNNRHLGLVVNIYIVGQYLSLFLYRSIDLICFIMFNATFSNISTISWRPVLVVEEAGANHRPWASNW
jgi:hypothetical protein